MGDVSAGVSAMWRLLGSLEMERAERGRQLQLKNSSVKTPRPPTRHKRVAKLKSCGDLSFKGFDSNNNHYAVDWSSRDEVVTKLDDAKEGAEPNSDMSSKSDAEPASSREGRPTGRSRSRPTFFSSTPGNEVELLNRLVSNAPGEIPTLPVIPQIETGSFGEIASVAHQGWLTDQLRGRKVWGAISGQILCVYATNNKSEPLWVIQLMDCKVRPIEFQFGHDSGSVNRWTKHDASKSALRINKHQFLIENTRSRQKQMFGVGSKPELDLWISTLNQASIPDDHSRLSEDTGVCLDSPGAVGYLESSGATTESESFKLLAASEGSVISRLPSPLLPKKRDARSLSFSVKQHSDPPAESVGDFRKFLRREHHDDPHKPHPLKPSYETVQQPAPATVKEDESSRKSKSFLRTPLDFLLRRKKRSSSADDAKTRKRNVSSRSGNQRGSESSASSSEDYGKSASTNSDSFDRTSLPESPELPSRSLDRKHSQSLSLSLRRTATDFRDKILGSAKSSEAKELKLRDLGEQKLSGFLQCRLNYKFTKVFCAVCRGWLYLFKTNRPDCVPRVSVMLSQCSVTYVSEMEERKKSLFAFKLSQTGCPSVYLLADDQLTLAKWMMSLQAEGSKVQMDTDLAAEVHEKRLTQKARQARELGMSPDDRRLAKQVELQIKRNSCPVFSIAELHFLEGSADPGDTSMRGDKSGANEKGNNSMQSRTTDTFTGLPADIYEEEYSDVPCGIHDEPPMSKCEANTISTIDNLTLQQAYCILQPSQPQSNDICDAVSIPVQTNELPESKRPTQFSAISHEVNPTAKPRRVRTSKFSMDVKNESEKFLQSAMAAVRRTASLDKAVVQRPARFMPALSRPPSLYRSSPSQTSPSEDSDRVTSFFSPASCSPDGDIDAVDFGGSSSSVRNTLGDNDSRDPLPPTSGSHVQCESYVIPSQIHELALKEAWSKDEDFLLGVIKDQLRLRSQGEAGVARDVRGSDETVLIVNEEWGAGKDGKKQHSAPPKKAMESGETSDSSDPEAVTSFRKQPSIDEHSNATSGSMSASFTGSVTASSTGSFTSGVLNSGIDSGKMQGFVDKRGFDDKWTRFWCVLRQGCLYFYLRAEDRASTDVTDLSGYEATQLIDSFPGRRFILRLDHKDYITVIVSLDTRDDLTSWYQAVKAAAVPLKEKPSFSSQISDDVARPSPDETDARHPSPSAQTVKEKLLAEMLRQKEELEKIQAARLSLRNQDTDFQLSQLRGSSPTAAADQICALTRLKQRRMSTQIKLDAIKKHIGDTSASKERKTVFQIGRKKPDLVPLEVQGQKNDLAEQVKSLSSRLEALDTCITSHGATSPREAEPTDKSILKKGYSRYASDLNLSRAAQLANESKKEIFYGSNGDISARLKDKDMSRSTSLKSSVQKLAHRTFGRANWHWSRKSTSPTEDKEDTKANPPVSPPNYLSEVTPDVIDMTNNNTQVNGKLSMMVDGKDICAPPDGFKTDYKFLSSTLPKNRGVVSVTTHRSYTMSTSSSALSSSSTHLDRLSKRLIPSSSFPSLVESMVSEVGQVQGHRFLTAQKTNGQLPVSTAALDSVDSSGRTLAKGRSASLRREVTPSTLAQIEAFEELSNKFLKDSSK